MSEMKVLARLFLCFALTFADKGWEDVFGDTHSTTLPIMLGGNKSYLMGVHYQLTFMEAMDFCENIHMNLLTIESPEENERIRQYILNTNSGNLYWSAGARLLDGNTWLWMTTSDIIVKGAWLPGEPNSRTENCIAMERRGDNFGWNDLDCDRPINFICERPLDERREDSNPDEKNWQNVFTNQVDRPNLDLLHFEGIDYYIPREYRGNYLEALDFCQNINMKLVTIKSKQQNDKLYKYIRDTIAGDKFWSSATRLFDGRTWFWLTDSQPVIYTNWAPNEPSSVNEKCLELMFIKDKGLIWNDIGCTVENKVICERPSNYGYDNGSGQSNGDDDEKDYDEDGAGVHGNQDGKSNEDLVLQPESDEKFLKTLKQTKPGSVSTLLSNGKNYHLSRNILATQSQARTFCEYHNMKLVTIKNERKHSDLINILPYPVNDGPYWIDGKQMNGTWTWKSLNSPITFFDWQQGYPKQGEFDCLGVSTFGKYVNNNCNINKPFVCEEIIEDTLSGDDSGAIVNVFMTNNIVSKKGIVPQQKELISSQKTNVNSEGGYHITVDNNMYKC